MNTSGLSPWLADKPFQPALYSDADDQVKHFRYIERLAKEIDWPIQEVKPLYEDILADMKPNAMVLDYLPIFVSKKVRYLLRN